MAYCPVRFILKVDRLIPLLAGFQARHTQRSRNCSGVSCTPIRLVGYLDKVSIHPSSRAVILSHTDIEGETQRVTRVASGSLDALGSNGTPTTSSGCYSTGLPSFHRAGSCIAPLLIVESAENARIEVAIVAEGDIGFPFGRIVNCRL